MNKIQIKGWSDTESDIDDYKELDKAIKDFVSVQKEEVEKILENGIDGDLTSGMELLIDGKVVMKATLDINTNNISKGVKND